jgi:hypothetical protein
MPSSVRVEETDDGSGKATTGMMVDLLVSPGKATVVELSSGSEHDALAMQCLSHAVEVNAHALLDAGITATSFAHNQCCVALDSFLVKIVYRLVPLGGLVGHQCMLLYLVPQLQWCTHLFVTKLCLADLVCWVVLYQSRMPAVCRHLKHELHAC